ncbi:hypothetical protein K435DRAFT_742754, partial [Dendrothele bispora CBS 962.96]
MLQATRIQVRALNLSAYSTLKIILAPQEKIFGIPKDRITTAAFFDAVENNSVAKCLEGTREDVLDKITEWVQDPSGEVICWVHGPAGSGKSTIARSIASRFSKRAATFAFSRNPPKIMTNKNFFPTIASQLPVLVPSVGQRMQTALDSDPHILSRDLSTQLDRLILRPLCEQSSFNRKRTIILVVVDGLDECNEGECQNLVDAISSSVQDKASPKPIRFLLFGRYEPAIRKKLHPPYCSLDLINFSANMSIRKYYKAEFIRVRWERGHLMEDVTEPWPDDNTLDKLVEKTEGLFIYASTLVRFVSNGTDLPQDLLQEALE